MLRAQLTDALKQAMKSKDKTALSTVRLILAAIKDRDIQARTDGREEGISNDELLSLLQTMVKQRREAIALYEQGGRVELCEQEQAEIDVISRFLPKQMNETEIKEAVGTVIEETEAASIKDMGKVMTALRERFAGSMDFGKASGFVKQLLMNR